MLGFEYHWLLLNPLMRGIFHSIAVAAFCASCLFMAGATGTAAPARPAGLVAAAEPGVQEAERDWPRAALRLWFLVPHLLPLGPR